MTAAMATTTPAARAQAILRELESLSNPANVAGMARYGIRPAKAFGVSAPVVRRMAKDLGTDHRLAAELWKTGALEARMIGALVDDPARVTRRQMERWARDFDSWAMCDGVCCVLFDRTPHAVACARDWSSRPEEYVKRGGFVLMAGMAVHDKRAADAVFLEFLGIVEAGADDPRKMVRKGVNWALRQIGKRNLALHAPAVAVCRRLVARGGPARWVGSDALRELTSPATVQRMEERERRAAARQGRTRR
jgi:3-methyladenine DNA glycosylase AlkD